MTRSVLALSPRSLGSGGRARDLVNLPVWFIFLRGIFRTCIRHPRICGTIALWLFVTVHWHSAAAGLAIVIGLWALVCFVVIWWTRRGSAVGIIGTIKIARALAKFKRLWPAAADAIGFVDDKTERIVPKLRRVRITGSNISAIVKNPLGKSTEDLSKESDRLRSAFGCRDFIVREQTPGYTYIEARYSDALTDTIPLEFLAASPKGSLAFGLTANGTPATIKRHLSLLIVGMAGSGKSSTLWSIIAAMISSGEPVKLDVIDPAGGVELDALEKHVNKDSTARFAIHQYANTVKQAEELIKNSHRAMHSRLASMKDKGVRFHIPSISEPRRVILIDEFLLIGMAKHGSGSPLGEILTIGRKAGFIVIALSQAGTVDELGAVRRLFPQRICMRVESSSQTNAVLGDGAHANGAHCSSIPESTPGIGYMVQEGEAGYTKFRAVLVTDAEAQQLAAGVLPVTLANRSPVPLSDQPTWLYRWYGRDDELLYVGISNDTIRRTFEHMSDKPWIDEMRRWAREDEPYSNRKLAEQAETEAIQTENPKYNKAKRRKTAPTKVLTDA